MIKKADLFVASESYFSTVVAVTSPAVKIVPLSASKTFFDRKLCNGMGLCALDDHRTLSDNNVTAAALHNMLLENKGIVMMRLEEEEEEEEQDEGGGGDR